jgi:hypothetical protein
VLALHKDFAKRKHCIWLHGQYNARALHKQFPEYTLDTFYRIRKGIMPKYMPLRVYLTFREFLAYAEYNRQEAYKLKSLNLEVKYKLSEAKVRQEYKSFKENNL